LVGCVSYDKNFKNIIRRLPVGEFSFCMRRLYNDEVLKVYITSSRSKKERAKSHAASAAKRLAPYLNLRFCSCEG
jgi:hypothetical protein